ncbi:23S rRNA (uracil(1939)-C(5))-methyltransferase RlmD [Paenibacillus sp. P25]|nr:23S rRNA (uracil(1939)-C(5))-methyltransferase RlmD [Paenibacillus sp. P25]
MTEKPKTQGKAGKHKAPTGPSAGRFGKGAGAPSAEDVRPGDRLVVTIKRIGINGEGVGYYKRKAVFVEGALPGEVVKATVVQVEPSFISARLAEIEKASPQRQTPPCPVYAECGGRQPQHLNYAGQLEAKEELVREAFRRYAGMDQPPMRPILGMEDPWGYRNKAQLQTGYEGGRVLTGLYSPGDHRLVDISGRAVQDPAINRVIGKVKSPLEELRIPIYNERKRQGVIRTIVARVGRASGKVQLTFVTAEDRIPDVSKLVRLIRDESPEVTTIAQNINKDRSPLIFGSKTVILWGKERLDETLGDVRFSLSPRAFFQLNPSQTVKLYDAVKEAAALTGRELVVDAYCGTGTIGLWLSPMAREVRGIEVIPEAVEDARDNARASGAENALFFAGRAEPLLPEWVRRGIRPDVVVVDPPRTGCERPSLEALAQAKPARLVYVSCNPSTLAKDCRVLLDRGFRLEWIQPVDMFPHTAHVECCVSLVRKS